MWLGKVVGVVLVVVVVVPVAGNYSIATGGGMAAVDELMGNADKAGERAVQAGKEAKEVLGDWGGWAKDKVQHALTPNHSHPSSSGVGQHKADKAGNSKEKVHEEDSEAIQKTTNNAQQATDDETTKDIANKARLRKGKAVQQEDSEETSYKGNEDQNTCLEAEVQAEAEAEAEAKKIMSDGEAGSLYKATKRKASDAMHNAKRKIRFTGTCHDGEL